MAVAHVTITMDDQASAAFAQMARRIAALELLPTGVAAMEQLERAAEPELPSLGLVTTAIIAGAALAGSTSKRITRRALLGLGLFERET